MMRASATIKEKDIEYRHAILPEIPTHNGYTLPFSEAAFRDPGKVQFEAALENYKPGIQEISLLQGMIADLLLRTGIL